MSLKISDAVVEAVSGSLGSVLALLATYPLKTIYTVQALSADRPGAQAAALSTLDIIKKYKLTGLYVGIEPNIFESAVSSGVYFYLYSKLRHLVVSHSKRSQGQVDSSQANTKNRDIGVLASLLVAALAGAGNQLVTMPASVVATRMQAMQKHRADSSSSSSVGVRDVIDSVYQESGVTGFWRGLLPSLVLVSNPAIQYMLYEQLLRLFKKWKSRRQQQVPSRSPSANSTSDLTSQQGELNSSKPQPAPVKLSAGEIFMASALAKIGATVATYWLVVVKSRLQAGGKGAPKELQYAGTWDAISQIYMHEGMGGFFKGLKTKILQTALNAALMLMLKEQLYAGTKQVLNSEGMHKVVMAMIKA